MGKQIFIETESFKHRLAKNLLADWLREKEKTDDYVELLPFRWRSNYGVFTELKFYETSDPYYFECSEGLYDYDDPRRPESPIDWFKPNFDRGKILFVPDITIFHKGCPTILIEVVHKSPLTSKKIHNISHFFSGGYIELYEIEAEEILRHTEIPQALKCKQIL